MGRHFEAVRISCSHSIFIFCFRINWCFLSELIITIMIDKWQFSNSITPFKLISWPSTVRKNFVFSPCIYSFVYLCQCGLRFLFYSMGCNLLLSLFILMFKLSHIWPRFGPPFKLSPVSCWYIPWAHGYINTFWYKKMLQTHIALSMPQTWNQPFPRGFLLGNCISIPRSGH